MKDKAVKRSGKKIVLIVLVSLLAVAVLAGSLFFGISSCTNKGGQLTHPNEGTTVRKVAPTDGTKPTDHSAIDNIAYMAYVLDNQPSYHAYANNSTKSTGYEQITQTWKDYKSADLSGIGQSVMVCSDLSYSMLVKASTQTCFVGGTEAYMRVGGKPAGKNTVPSEVSWSGDKPSYYTKDEYRKVYGDFSTELSVYLINEDTVESSEEVVDNNDGTYSQKFYLTPDAAYWYQYGMKTRGSLKVYPEFEKIEITFTFDGKWQVLNTYCEEKTKIAPSALGGVPMGSTSKTTTTFDYSNEAFDGTNYGYFNGFYKQYLGTINSGEQPPAEEKREMLDVLGSAFSSVVNPNGNGQQFGLSLTIGETQYSGKVYAKLTDMGDILGTLDVRLALSKSDSGKQDLFVQFKDGAVNVYYSDGFALVADINKVAASVGRITEWVNSFKGEANLETVVYALEEAGGIDLDSLINAINFTWNDTSACVSIVSDDLLGLGIGLDMQLNVDSFKDDSGWHDSFKNLSLGSITYKSEPVKIGLELVPDSNAEIISRDKNNTSADLADFIDGVYNLLNSKTYLVDISLDGTSEIEYINGIVLNATAQVKLSEDYKDIAVKLPVSVSYSEISAELEAYYTINLDSGNYGNVYLHLTNICGREVDAKVYCDISETVEAVTKLIEYFNVSSAQTLADEEVNKVAEIIGIVTELDYASIITDLKADEENISVTVNVDEVLSALQIELGIKFGELALELSIDNNAKATLNAELAELGLNVKLSGSEQEIVFDTNGYADVTTYVNGVYNLLNSETYLINVSLDGTSEVEYINGIVLNATAQVKLSEGYKDIAVKLPVSVFYGEISADLQAYYTINLDSGNYGNVYLHLTNICGREVDAKVYCNISETVEAVTKLIEYFNTGSATLADEEVNKVAEIIGIVTELDYASIITDLKADEENISVTVNVDEVLSELQVELGVKFGELALELSIDNNAKATLNAELAELGLNVNLSGSEQEIVFDTNGYADVTTYVNGVYNLLNSETYFVDIVLDGTSEVEYINGIVLNATAQVKLSEDYKDIAVKLPVSVSYGEISAELEAYYTINLDSGNYGNVYLHLTNICGREVDAKVYCDISETVEAVTKLIEYFNTGSATLADEEVNKVAEIIGIVTELDYASIITELKADEENISVTINVDEVLSALQVELGVKFGELALELSIDNNAKATLNAELAELGLNVNLSGSEQEIVFDTNGYADVTTYVNGVYNLLNSETYFVDIVLDGSSEIEYINGIVLNATAQVKLSEGYKDIAVKLPLSISYGEISAELQAYYTINLDSGNYGNVYLHLTNICGREVDAKVYCDISETIEAVTKLIEYFNTGSSTLADEEVNKVAEIIGIVTELDYASIITDLKADEENISVTINVDEVLSALQIELGVKFGELALELSIDNNAKATLNAELSELGLNVNLSGSEQEIAFDTNGYADVTTYVNGVYNLLNSETYFVDIALDGTSEIEYINGIVLNATAQVKLSEDYKDIAVKLPVSISYGEISAELEAYYTINLDSGNYGNVYLHLTNICGREVDAKVYCNISETVEAVTKLIEYFNTGSATLADEEVNKVAEIIGIVTELDYASIITELKADEENISVTVNVDEVLSALQIELGVKFGELALELSIDNNAKATLNAELAELGLNVNLSGSEQEIAFDTNGYADVTTYVNGVYNLIDGKTYLVDIALDGSSEIEYINGVEAYASAQVAVNDTFSEITVGIPELTVSYMGITVVLDIYYTINLENSDYGDIYLNLVSINGEQVGAKVYCNIADTVYAVTSLINTINGANTIATLSDDGEAVEKITGVIGFVTSIDYAEIITELKADDKSINLTVNADKILEAFSIELGMQFGTVSLDISIDNNNKVKLDGNIPALGLALNISGDYNEIIVPVKDEYLDVTELINLITAATQEAEKIIASEDILFEIDATLTVDGVAMNVSGNGEVIWSNGKIRVAADVSFTISEKENSEVLAVKFLYDETRTPDEPLVRFSVNNLGLEIYQQDIDGVKNQFGDIMHAVNGLIGAIGGKDESVAVYSEVEETQTAEEQTDDSFGVVALDYASLLSTALKIANNVVIKLQNSEITDAEVKDLIISYAQNGKLALTSNGDLALALEIQNNNGTQIAEVTACVKAGDGKVYEEYLRPVTADTDAETPETEEPAEGDEQTEEPETQEPEVVEEPDWKFKGVKFYTAETFLKAVYEYVFDLCDSLTVKNLLGNNTYSVEVVFNGSESGIDALDGIEVYANLYYTEVENGENSTSKLVEAELNLNIKDTAVKVNVYFTDRNLYIKLMQIGDTKLENIAIKASTDDIYGAAEALVKIITSDAVAKVIENLSGEPAPAMLSVENGENGIDNDAVQGIINLVNYLLNIELGEVIQFNGINTDGETHNTLTVNTDALINAFGSELKIGLIHVEVNPATHSIFAVVSNEESSWITFCAQAVENGENGTHSLFVPDDSFIDIGFVADLLDDINATLDGMTDEVTDEQTGETQTKTDVRVSFTGNLKINAVVKDIDIINVTLTAGFDENNKFYASLHGNLQDSKFIVTLATASEVSFTYSDGYLTFGRDVGSDSPKFKVVTIAYLIDNLLNDNSPLFWWLGTSDITGLLNIIPQIKNLNLSSGLNKTEDFYLYDNGTAEPVVPEEKVVNLADILKGLSVKINGNTSGFGNVSDVDSNLNKKFSLTDNYYAANLDLLTLIGDETLKDVYVAIARNEEGGLKGLDAYANVANALKITAKLDGGVTKSHAINYFSTVESSIDFDYYKNYQYKIFGCYDTASGTYTASEINKPCELTVYGFEGEDYANYEQFVRGEKQILVKTLNSGSNVFLFDEVKWLDEEHTRKLIYVDGDGNDLGLSFVISADTAVYQMVVGAKEATFHNGESVYTNSLFVGEPLPEPEMYADGKTFAGWYLADGSKTAVMLGEVTEYFAKYVDSNTVINGVVYTFVKDSKYSEGGYYEVSGTTDVSYYNDYGRWLVLENEIENELGVFKVIKIGDSALANKGLKNVIAPENISYIGKNAFSDNNDIRNVVFLADVVSLDGKLDDKTYPFYGCTVGSDGGKDDGRKTNLNVYYKSIVTVSGEEYAPDDTPGIFCWQHVRTFTEWFTTKHRYIQNNPGSAGSKLYTEGQWAYVDYRLNGDADGLTVEDLWLENFVTASAEYNTAGVENEVKQALNAITAKEGFINAYDVKITGEYTLDGRVVLNVTLKLLPESERWYFVSANGVYGEEQTAVTISGDIITFNEQYFVKAGSTVTLVAYNGLMFDGCDFAEADLIEENYVLYMPEHSLEINVTYKKKPISEVKLLSTVESTYKGESANGYVVTLEPDVTVLETPVAEGYMFLGWAYDVLGDGNLAFVESSITVQSAVPEYFAIWASARDEITSVSTLTNGTDPNAAGVTVDSAKAKGFYKWYSDDAFENEVNAITTQTTVLYARLIYTLNITFDGGSGSRTDYTVSGSQTDSKSQEDYTLIIDVLEGGNVSIKFEEKSDSYWFTKYYWNNCIVTYDNYSVTVAGKKYRGNTSENRKFSIVYNNETYSTGNELRINDFRSNINLTSVVDSASK